METLHFLLGGKLGVLLAAIAFLVAFLFFCDFANKRGWIMLASRAPNKQERGEE